MKHIFLLVIFIYSTFSMASQTIVKAPFKYNQEIILNEIDTTKIQAFFKKYPKLRSFQNQVKQLYKKHVNYIWYDQNGISEFAYAFYTRIGQINEEGLHINIPYQSELDQIFQYDPDPKINLESELLMSSMYFFYTDKVFNGLTEENSTQTGWHLPREKTPYNAYLDTIIKNLEFKKEFNHDYFNQYYALKKALKKYIEIEKNGGWIQIKPDKGIKSLQEGDSSITVQQVRTRLFTEGYIDLDSGNLLFDKTVLSGVIKYENTQNRNFEHKITPDLIKLLNVSVEDRIKTISVNMERCRWISPKINDAKEYIAVNIPSFRLFYFRDSKPYLISKVIVGKEFNKTTVFSGKISYIAFAPYWNVPNSIYQKEILPKLKKNPDYLQSQNMEWHNGRIRQKPGPGNALGLVKFIFPNSNNIYLHDTPMKSLFKNEKRAYSHGCIRVEKAHELALTIMEKEAKWTPEKVNAAMHSGKESIYVLKETIPVYIAYFTAWADQNENIAFYNDIYNRDNNLARMLFSE
ncbi:L,D-transpeptidase family protein [Flavobacterium piscis]|uniref:Murein L,D-transpeptidase YcbB/YkuD n=1 Tax=Flavobacterium piscis TaxID=1114874 RepID=A0ABU1YED8_9FLAO|nr:L,D-transpeptidase family protein [Flavobacterium piscis]MDR7211901.1 murein L,D-transpeptidase YcbB/YkuD [Flavobacterium piscis]